MIRWLVVVAMMAACAYAPPKFAIKHVEQRGRLDGNGLHFVIMPDPGATLAEVAVRYDVGSSDDPPGKAGLAHLVEHLRFLVRTGDADPRTLRYFFERLATAWNAYTNDDETHYYALARPQALEQLLQLEALRLHDGCRSISEAEFEREREVVRNEIRQRTGTPEGQVEPLLVSSLYPPGHPYARMVGGDDAQISALTLEDACAFMDHYYVPERATLVIAGQVDSKQAVGAIQKWFGGLARRSPWARRPIPPVALDTKRQTFDLDIERPIVAVSWTLPPQKTIEDAEAIDTFYERLHGVEAAVRQYGFGSRVAVQILGGRFAPIITVAIELDDLAHVDQALDFTWKAVRHEENVFERDLVHDHSRLQTERVLDLESITSRAIRVADLAQLSSERDFMAPGNFIYRELDTLGSLDIGALETRVRRELDPAYAHVTVFRPTHEGIKGDARATFVFHRGEDLNEPDDDATEAQHPLDISKDHDALARAIRFELDNGLRVVLLPIESTLPIVTAKLIFDAGDATDPDHPRLANATARFSRPAPAVRRKLWRAGIRNSCSSTPDHTTCTTQAMAIYFHEAIEGLERRFRFTDYDQKAIELWQEQEAHASKRKRIIADELDHQELAALFGADHPYTRGRLEAPGSERAIGRDELYAFRDAHFNAANATLVVTGAFDVADAKDVIKDAFGGWPRGHASSAPAPAHRTVGATYVGIVRDAGPQMDVVLAFPSPAGIGGQQAARLVVAEMMRAVEARVRGQLGASYGAQTRRDERRGPSRYEVRASIDAARAGDALRTMRDGLEELRTGADFDVQFVRARRTVAHHLLDESAASFDLATRLATIARFDLPGSYYETLLRQVAVITPAQVKAIVATELAKDQEVVVAAADRDTLVAAFAEAGITDYKLVEPITK